MVAICSRVADVSCVPTFVSSVLQRASTVVCPQASHVLRQLQSRMLLFVTIRRTCVCQAIARVMASVNLKSFDGYLLLFTDGRVASAIGIIVASMALAVFLRDRQLSRANNDV